MTGSGGWQLDSALNSIVAELELTDLDADRYLLELPGISLVIFTSAGCAACRWARRQLPTLELPIDRLCWIDAGRNGGLVERYAVFHLPALFLVRDGRFLGALQACLESTGLSAAIASALNGPEEELP
ncbi:thioredoxin [Zestomonas thermotolerans]|uniref:thioredoxin n=1 Tax=Zestomonas thermotolerans TaxID=157784 RepID=UPI000687ACC4|nr:thioredoxin [Pseudomonas thermotolerans]